MAGPETPGEPGDRPPPPRPDHDKGYSAETSGGTDTDQPAGIAGAEPPSKEAAEFSWGCIALIVALFVVGAAAWFVSGG